MMRAIFKYLGVLGVILILMVTPFTVIIAWRLVVTGHYLDGVFISLFAFVMVWAALSREQRRREDRQQYAEARRLIELCQIERRSPTESEWVEIDRGLR